MNNDATPHNVHALPMSNQGEFNHGQKEKDPGIVHTFTVPEVMVRFKCDARLDVCARQTSTCTNTNERGRAPARALR